MAAYGESFRQRLLKHELLIGTWIKTPSPIVCEVLGRSDLDTVCLDAEHAPFGRLELDACIAACRSAGSSPLVRLPSAASHYILNALDCGASGVVVPHIKTAGEAEALCQKSLYGPGGRGYSGSPRAAGFGARAIGDHLKQSAEDTAIIAQVEDLEAVEAIDEIVTVERIDCLFVGRIDLTIALGKTDPAAPEVVAAVEKICASCRNAGKPVGMFVSDPEETNYWRERGASFFLLGSDHGFLISGARQLVSSLR